MPTTDSQVGVILLPPLGYAITMRICLGLQRADRDKPLYGRETGRIVRSLDGRCSEIRVPLNQDDAYAITPAPGGVAYEPGPEADENGAPTPRTRHATMTEEISHDR